MLGVQLLHAALAGEDVCQVVNAKRLLRGGMDGGQRLVRHVGLDVIPLRRNLILLKDEFFLFAHNFSFVFIDGFTILCIIACKITTLFGNKRINLTFFA
jgi:hypothetical protein